MDVAPPNQMRIEDALHAEITGEIIDGARAVFRELGYGFLEKVYENALVVELTRRGLRVQQQVPIQVYYGGVLVGVFDADLLVNDLVIIELKAIELLARVHEVQLVNYLRATKIEVGLLINFGSKFQVTRRILTNNRKGGVPTSAVSEQIELR